MSDFDNKLNTLLSNPDAMSQIMQLAQSLGGGETQEAAPSPSAPPPAAPRRETPSGGGGGLGDLAGLLGGLDPAMLTRLLPLLQDLNRPQSGQTAALLQALQPFLKEERRDKVAQAIRLSRMIHLGKQFFKGEG